MKLKKILASILCVAMVLSTMSTIAFAAEDTDIYEIGENQTYATLEAARLAAKDTDGDGAITYEIHGRVSTGYISESIAFVPSDRTGITTINFVGADDTAELYIPTKERAALDGGFNANYGIDVNVTNLICARPDGEWSQNFADGNNHFLMLLSPGATLTYTSCKFPNGVASNMKGTTIFEFCEFDNQIGNRTKQQYALWAFTSNADAAVVRVNECTFNGSKGVKVYSDNHTATGGADDTVEITKSEFNITGEPALVSSSFGTIELTTNEYVDNGYGVVATTGQSSLTVDGETPVYVASAPDKWGSVYNTQSVAYAEVLLEEAIDNGNVSNPTITYNYGSFDADNGVVLETADNAEETYIYFDIANMNATESIEIMVYSGETLLSVTELNQSGKDKGYLDLTNISATVEIGKNSSSWDTTWSVEPIYNMVPDKAELWIDGIKVDTAGISMYNTDYPENAREWGEVPGVIPAPACTINNAYTSSNRIWGETDCNARDSFEIKVYSDDTLIGTTSLNNINGIIDGDLYVTWGIYTDGTEDEYWTQVWEAGHPRVDYMPTKVVYYVDGTNVGETSVQFNGPDNLWPVEWGNVSGVYYAAQIGDVKYATIQAAVNAAVEGDNEIVILPGTYDESFMVNQAPGKNITITAENKGDVTLTGTISVNGNRRQDGAETLTISNLVFDGSDKTAAHNFIIDSNGTANYPTYAHNVTVTNCDFVGNGDFDNAVVAFREPKAGSNNIVFDNVTATGLHSLIQVSNSKKITVTNSTITNGESVVNATGSAEVVFTNNIVNVENFAVRTGQSSASTNTVANVTMNNNTIAAGVTALAMRNATTTAVMTDNSIVAPAAYTAENADASTINNVAITADEIDAAVNDNNEVIPESMSISFVQVEPGLYNIVITASDDIYEFVGAELTFANTSTTVANEPMNYEILGINGATNAEKSIEKDDTYALRLVDGAERMSGKDLVIGQVKFYGQGNINFTVSEGKVVTTEYGTNLGQYYTLDADDTTADTLTVNAITNGEVSEVTRDVVVNVAYKHALNGTYWKDAAGNAANQITVTLKDGFGNIYGPFDVSDELETIPDVKLGRLTVTLEAPGFRRYVYNTTLEAGADENDALVLNFWNDIKRDTVQSPLAEIEAGVSGETNKNFVVGDIVMDYTVDEYDLAAVTSYYGMYELTDADKYIKYDLNRDGNIDIIDVHYVLHTLNN